MGFYALQNMKMIPQSAWDTLAVESCPADKSPGLVPRNEEKGGYDQLYGRFCDKGRNFCRSVRAIKRVTACETMKRTAEDLVMDKEYFDALMERPAFAQGDTSRKVVEADAAVYETSGVAQDIPWESIGRMTFPATLQEKRTKEPTDCVSLPVPFI